MWFHDTIWQTVVYKHGAICRSAVVLSLSLCPSDTHTWRSSWQSTCVSGVRMCGCPSSPTETRCWRAERTTVVPSPAAAAARPGPPAAGRAGPLTGVSEFQNGAQDKQTIIIIQGLNSTEMSHLGLQPPTNLRLWFQLRFIWHLGCSSSCSFCLGFIYFVYVYRFICYSFMLCLRCLSWEELEGSRLKLVLKKQQQRQKTKLCLCL